MASALIPDKFETGDFPAWLRTDSKVFECCANANKWSEEDKLAKLPAFLGGPAAAHFHGLTEAQKESYANVIKHLKDALCPRVDREKFYSEFDHHKLRPDEDLHSCFGTWRICYLRRILTYLLRPALPC